MIMIFNCSNVTLIYDYSFGSLFVTEKDLSLKATACFVTESDSEWILELKRHAELVC